jgi:hypothetical protein
LKGEIVTPDPDLQMKTAGALLALFDLGRAIAAHRPDGDDVLAHVAAGKLRIVFDQQTAAITYGYATDEGQPVRWLETVEANPNDQYSFGRLASATLGTTTTLH